METELTSRGHIFSGYATAVSVLQPLSQSTGDVMPTECDPGGATEVIAFHPHQAFERMLRPDALFVVKQQLHDLAMVRVEERTA